MPPTTVEEIVVSKSGPVSGEMVPRHEYPRPQFVRDRWLCLNGQWQFEVDGGDTGRERGLIGRDLVGEILVPFCPEAPLSGIGTADRMAAVWYRRTVEVPADWADSRIILHFQAVDYESTVWVNGVEVGRHTGGFTPFACDCSKAVKPGEVATVVVRARDPWWLPQPRGKQTGEFVPSGARYGRTTGIWQSVWMEPVPQSSLERPRITPDVEAGCFRVEVSVSRPRAGLVASAVLRDQRGEVVRATRSLVGDLSGELDLDIPADRQRLWRPTDPFLYDLELLLTDDSGALLDRATSYAGLRSVGVDGQALLLNGEIVFQRLVLDQGFYEGGVMTAPSDAALVEDIELAKAAGFNGARLHQKVFEERFLYHADRLGYLVWGEFGDWGCSGFGPSEDHQRPGATYITQWLEAVARDYSHPSIVGWCPMNETYQPLGDRPLDLDEVTLGMYLATKATDRTRPVIDASGYSHRVCRSDVYDSHDYEQDPEVFSARHDRASEGAPFVNTWRGRDISVPYEGQPYLVSEFGGTWWEESPSQDAKVWGYGTRPKSVDELVERFAALCGSLLDNPAIAGYCYTQLTDVYQERNGICDFSRRPKMDLGRLRAVQDRDAAIERAARGAPSR